MARRGFLGVNWATGRGALLAVALLFIASAIVRFSVGVGPAISQELAALGEEPAPPVAADAPPSEPAACRNPAELDALLSEIAARQGDLAARAAQLDDREQALSFARAEIDKRLAELQAAEKSLSELLALSETAAEQDLARLTAVYENMKPQQAAKLFEKMAPEFAAGFMGRMRPDAAAQIMAGLPADQAYAISVILAGRNAEAPTE